jgi:hypothetical protein
VRLVGYIIKKSNLLSKPTKVQKCVKVYYKHCIRAACFGQSYGREWQMAIVAETCSRYIQCVKYTFIHLRAFVGFDIPSNYLILYFSFSVKVPAATENKRRPV